MEVDFLVKSPKNIFFLLFLNLHRPGDPSSVRRPGLGQPSEPGDAVHPSAGGRNRHFVLRGEEQRSAHRRVRLQSVEEFCADVFKKCQWSCVQSWVVSVCSLWVNTVKMSLLLSFVPLNLKLIHSFRCWFWLFVIILICC